jgi:hypothetical protein
MTRHMRSSCLSMLVAAIAWHLPALADTTDSPSVSERPFDGSIKPPDRTQATYGTCNGPPNADAHPMSPVPVIAGTCDDYQSYTSVGSSASFGCGGYTVAFGPKGDLKPYLDRVNLSADWGDETLTQSQCTKAKLVAVAWGARCADDACARGTAVNWEKIGSGPKQRSGSWQSNECYIHLNFPGTGKKYVTLMIDIIATLEEGDQPVRKNAKGKIYASRPNGTCLSLPDKPPMKTWPTN